MKIHILSAILLLLSVSISATEITISKIPNHSQLSSEELLCIFQDSEGYMWYGTEGGGLCRDDGYDVRVYRSDFNTPNLLESNTVTCIAEDDSRKIWFGTRRGLYILNKAENYTITPFPIDEIKGWDIKAILIASNGVIWISADKNIFRYDGSKILGKYNIEWKGAYPETNSIYEDPLGKIWITQKRGGLFSYDPQADCFNSYPWPYTSYPYPTGIIKDKRSPYYWISSFGQGIVRFDPKASQPDSMFVPQKETLYTKPQKRRLHHIFQDDIEQYLWVIAAEDLHVYKINEDHSLSRINTDFMSTGKKLLTGITSDRLGNLWVTGYYPRSFIVSFLPNEIISHSLHNLESITGFSVAPMHLYVDSSTYWIRQKRLGLFIYNSDKDTYAVMRHKDYSLSFFFEKASNCSGVYVVKNETTVSLIQEKDGEFLQSEICTIPFKDGERIRAMHDDKQGNLWIGTTFNLFKYDVKQELLTIVCENVGFINSIASSKDKIYLATENAGFWEIANGKKKSVQNLNENCVVLHISSDQCVWIGTLQGNVYCYNPETGDFIRQTDKCGLTGDIIGDIDSDNTGNIWILTGKKIVVYNQEEQTTDFITGTDPSIGLEGFTTLHKDKNGKIHIGGKGGIIVFPQYNKMEATGKQSIQLTSVRINNQPQLQEHGEKK